MRGLNIFWLTIVLAVFLTAKRDLGTHQQKLEEDPTTKKVSSNQEEQSKHNIVPDTLPTTVNMEKLHLRKKRAYLPIVSLLHQEQQRSKDPTTKKVSATQEEQSKADFVPENLLTMSNEEKQNWKKNKATISTFSIQSLYNRLFERLFYQEEQSWMEDDIEEKKQNLRKPQSIVANTVILVNQYFEAAVHKK